MNSRILGVNMMNYSATPSEAPSFVPLGFYSFPILSAFTVLVVAYLIQHLAFGREGNKKVHVPIIGPKDTIRARWQFFRYASTFVNEGYEKARNFYPICLTQS